MALPSLAGAQHLHAHVRGVGHVDDKHLDHKYKHGNGTGYSISVT